MDKSLEDLEQEIAALSDKELDEYANNALLQVERANTKAKPPTFKQWVEIAKHKLARMIWSSLEFIAAGLVTLIGAIILASIVGMILFVIYSLTTSYIWAIDDLWAPYTIDRAAYHHAATASIPTRVEDCYNTNFGDGRKCRMQTNASGEDSSYEFVVRPDR